ncbi:bifunctional phosphopantothenoylcysteine decarboxylase/phosphopantothenate--cysteine ligase CoaBC [Candidatus Formimonas warabiya]|uniref:Coenzyme A biosynthesis bifunctional protein CoaBC n=1 Tax=Formimonas warabiya TaxID=1761012 RepID=A0A3G1KRR3_FORW1|nr:bifunctional phosphopantothenoylcysteine decarboxylase/phosphopantothenate--cysteine ligase CoaBC [Candidatus Formimonas warabiya]ATW24825.1 bifunctional 4'-phosphopantothenoylcysteine decarboxylase/phosphopantothenoylcysteine synthetase [Candidatus Formimonas warabiya]
MSQGKTIVLGITGGIAAYKSAELVSRLAKKKYDIHVIMTASAQHFVHPLTFRTLSGNPVVTDMFAEPGTWNVQHISLAEKADLMAIVPATANILGKMAHGLADDMLSTTVLAATCPVLIAPAMNVNMYLHPVVQDNIKKLIQLGYHLVEPATGHLACGTEGKGRLADIDVIEQAMLGLVHPKTDFSGKNILVTAGPTREALDPIRFLSNHSTGKMGYALAAAAQSRGADVHLVTGPTCLADPAGVKITKVVSALEMHDAVLKAYPQVDIVIKTAAVADYRPKEQAAQKIKKKAGELTLVLERNPDILWELGQAKKNQFLVGFAAETDNLIGYAQEKMREKNLDLVVANNVAEEGAGFGGTTNIVTMITRAGQIIKLPQMTKLETAHAILDQIRMLANYR